MAFFSNAIDKLSGALDKAQDLAAGKVVSVLEPRVRTVIDEKVEEFRATSLASLPQTCEARLKEQSDNSAVAWLFDKVLGERTDVLVAHLVERFRPGVTSATQGLGPGATQLVMERLRDMLDGIDEGQEQQAPSLDETARSLGDQPEQEPRGGGGGFRAISSALNLESRLPGWEARTRALVHPLFEEVQAQVWALVPAALRDAVAGLQTGDAGTLGQEGDEQTSAREGGGGGGGLGGWVQGKLHGVVGNALEAALARVDDPARALVSRLVLELEEGSMSAAFAEVRQRLASVGLVSAPAEQVA